MSPPPTYTVGYVGLTYIYTNTRSSYSETEDRSRIQLRNDGLNSVIGLFSFFVWSDASYFRVIDRVRIGDNYSEAVFNRFGYFFISMSF
jgi:hypothetical protein